MHQAVSDALTAAVSAVVDEARAFLQSYDVANRGGVSGTLKQLLRDWAAVRAHIDHPDLCIPTSTNVVESMLNLLRDTAASTSTVTGILRRVTALVRLHPTFVCNGTICTQH